MRRTKRSSLRASILFLIAMTAFVLIVDRDNLPEGMRDSKAVEFIYELRGKILAGVPQQQPPAAAEDPGKKQLGYPEKDREKLDTLIDKGAQDP